MPDDTEADATAPNPVTWKAPGSDLVPVERVDDAEAVPDEPKRRGSILWPVLAALGLAALIALGVLTFVLWNKVDDLEDQVAKIQTNAADIEATAKSAAKDAAQSAVQPVKDDVAKLQDQVDRLQQTADELRAAQAGRSSSADLAALTTRLESVITCVNSYMDVVSRANNANTSYVYQICS